MSYCVNCGVELDNSAKKCALCSTPVINPNQPKAKEETTPFAPETHIPPEASRRFIAYIVSMVMLVPNIVCFFINVFFRNHGFWALYVNTSSLLLWVVLVFPFITKKLKPYLMWAFDTVSVIAYSFFFFVMGNEKETVGWFYNSALPLILSVSAVVLLYIIWVKAKKRHWALTLIGVIIAVSIESFVTGFVLDFSLKIEFALEIGIIAGVSCALLVLCLIYCYKSKAMRKWLSDRIFI